LAVTVPANRVPSVTLQHAQSWARGLVAALHVHITRHGTPPAVGALIVANHRSYIDAAVLLCDVPCTFLAKAELARWPVVGWAARLGHAVFVQRDDRSSRRASRDAIGALLRDGASVAVFPEGTTHTGPGVLPFKRGIFEAAAENGFPVVPAAIEFDDRRDAWVGDATFVGHFVRVFGKARVPVTVRYGPVFTGADAETLRATTEAWIARALGAAPGDLSRGEAVATSQT
jgi:1-acyl-sn-glycerol-3-phosphate acyltransferase